MTPEERAAAAHARLGVRGLTADNRDVRVIADAIRDAVAEERERCVRLLEGVRGEDGRPGWPELDRAIDAVREGRGPGGGHVR